MSIERVGTAVVINTDNDTGSQSITVPTDAQIAIAFYGGYADIAEAAFSSGGYSISIGDEPSTHVNRSPIDTTSNDVACSYVLNPPVGTQLIEWTLSSSILCGHLIVVVFYKGINISDPIVSSGGNDSPDGATVSVSGLSYSSGDIVVGGAVEDNAPPGVSINSQTAIANTSTPDAKFGSVYISVGEKLSSGTFTASKEGDGLLGVVALVLRQGSAPSISLAWIGV